MRALERRAGGGARRRGRARIGTTVADWRLEERCLLAAKPTVLAVHARAAAGRIASYEVRYLEPVVPSDARRVAVYRLVLAGKDGKFGTRDDRTRPVRSVNYDAEDRTARVRLRSPVQVGTAARLRVLATKVRVARRPEQPWDVRPAPVRLRSDALTFRVLFLIKPETDVRLADGTRIRGGLPADVIEQAYWGMTRLTDNLARSLSGRRIGMKVDVVVSRTPVRTVSPLGNKVWVAPEDVRDDLKRVGRFGVYDSVIVLFSPWDERSGKEIPIDAYGLGMGPTDATYGMSYAMVKWLPSDPLYNDQPGRENEVFLHEWLHGLEGFYASRGVAMPTDGLHGAEEHGFPAPNERGWKDWYKLFLRGRAREPDGRLTGLGPRAWRLGTIREWYRLRNRRP